MMDNIEQMNKEVAEWLGICWHEDMSIEGKPDGAMLCRHCGQMFAGDHVRNPDFSQDAGIIRLLKEMMKREDWDEFSLEVGPPIAKTLGFGRYPLENKSEAINHDYITTPGKLLDAVAEWIKEHPATS
jgi:hypothetical protein